MKEELKTCVEAILGSIEKIVLSIIGLTIIILITSPFGLSYYLKYEFMIKCIKKDSLTWCEEVWMELEKLD